MNIKPGTVINLTEDKVLLAKLTHNIDLRPLQGIKYESPAHLGVMLAIQNKNTTDNTKTLDTCIRLCNYVDDFSEKAFVIVFLSIFKKKIDPFTSTTWKNYSYRNNAWIIDKEHDDFSKIRKIYEELNDSK